MFFTDEDINKNPDQLENALRNASVLLVSLVFDFNQVNWLQQRTSHIPYRLIFESALELMQLTKINSFQMKDSASADAKKKPSAFGVISNAFKSFLAKFGLQGREEDKLAGYLQMLKTGPKLLKLIPGQKMKDVRDWLTIYSYWNAGSVENIAYMVWYMTKELLKMPLLNPNDPVPDVRSIESKGVIHPSTSQIFSTPAEYMQWYLQTFPSRTSWPRIGVLLYRKHVISKLGYIDQLVEQFEQNQLLPIPVFITGVESHIIVRDYFTTENELKDRRRGIKTCSLRERDAATVSAIVSTIGFPLVGGPAGSMEAGRKVQVAKRILKAKNVPYIVSAPLITQDIESWNAQGIGGLQSIVLYVLPELDGAIDCVPLGGLVGNEIELLSDRLSRLSGRLQKWINLQCKPRNQVKIAVVVYSYPPGVGSTGTAALLNVPQSLYNLAKALKSEGYDVGDILDEKPDEILKKVKVADDLYSALANESFVTLDEKLQNMNVVSRKENRAWLGEKHADRIGKKWGKDGEFSEIKSINDNFYIGGVQYGNLWVSVQPGIGVPGDPMRLLFEKDMTPHPQYAAFYRWIENGYKADAMIHFGMHGTSEWLPGPSIGNNEDSWPDILLGNVPNLYIYAANNPSESAICKRRGYATTVSHLVPCYCRAGLYTELAVIKGLVDEYQRSRNSDLPLSSSSTRSAESVFQDILAKVEQAGLDQHIKVDAGQPELYVDQINEYLSVLENRLFADGLHVLGQSPKPEELVEYLKPLVASVPQMDDAMVQKLAVNDSWDAASFANALDDANQKKVVLDAKEARDLLLQCDEEISSLLTGLRGEYIEPAPAGDVIRDGKLVLPSGRNIYSLDPYRLPSQRAYDSAVKICDAYIEQFRNENQGRYPETIAVPLWGMDNIKTNGEGLSIILGFVGATIRRDATGRTVSFDLIPLEELGRPRIDVLVSMSGIFRDCFENIVDLLDDVMQKCSDAKDEPLEKNFVKKHHDQMIQDKVIGDSDSDSGTAVNRIFSNPAGDFGSLVTEQITTGGWEISDELGDTWKGRNAYAYGRNKKGENQKGVLEALLGTTDGLLQEIDSVEYGLGDIQEYYANSGAMFRAAKNERKRKVQQEGGISKVQSSPDTFVPKASFVEAFTSSSSSAPKVQDLDDLLHLEYRSKLLNPKWRDSMLKNGSGGGYEIGSRFQTIIGWAGTADFQHEYIFNQAANNYVMDRDVAQKLKELNPEAYRNVVARLLEAHGRKFWKSPNPEVLNQIQQDYDDIDAEIEGVTLEE